MRSTSLQNQHEGATTLSDPMSDTVAVVLGGSNPNDAFAQEGITTKALYPVGGKPLASYVLAALNASASVSQYIYVGDSTPELRALTSQTLTSGATLASSLQIGLDAALKMQPERILVISADLLWLTEEAVDTFITDAPDAALVYPIIAREVAERQFPGQKRTYAKLKEGTFTGGNALLLEPHIIPTLLPFVNRAYEKRKNPLSLVRLLGLGFVLKLLTGRLRIGRLERRVSDLLGMRVRAYLCQDASLGADVDEPAHLGH